MYTQKLLRATFLAAIGALAATATSLDFQGVGSSTLTSYTLPGDGSIFSLVSDTISTGTGTFPAFLRIQASGNATSEQGYNTEGSPLPYDEKAGNWTRNILFSQLGTVTQGGVDYFRLLLDWNESGGSKTGISLVDLRIYSGIPNLTSKIGEAGFTSNTTELWNLQTPLGNAGYDSMNFVDANAGSGRADLNILIPQTLLSGRPDNQPNFILYAKFNNVDGGFEEFSYFAGTSTQPIPPDVPEPATFMMLGGGLAALGLVRRFRQ